MPTNPLSELKNHLYQFGKEHKIGSIQADCVLYILLTKYEEPTEILRSVDIPNVDQLADKLLKIIKVSTETSATAELGSTSLDVLKLASQYAGNVLGITELHFLSATFATFLKHHDYRSIKEIESILESSIDSVAMDLDKLITGKKIQNKEVRSGHEMADSLLLPYEANMHTKLISNSQNLSKLKALCNAESGCLIVISGDSHTGKSTLINQLALESDRQINYLEHTTLVKQAFRRGKIESELGVAIKKCLSNDSLLVIEDVDIIESSNNHAQITPILIGAAREGLKIVCTSSKSGLKTNIRSHGYDEYLKVIQLEQPKGPEFEQIIKAASLEIETRHNVILNTKIVAKVTALVTQHMPSNKLKAILDCLNALAAQTKKGDDISQEDIVQIVSAMSSKPTEEIEKSKTSRLSTLSDDLKSELFGQDESLEEIASRIKASVLGFQIQPNRPNAIFALLGESGVGKTKTAELIAQKLNYNILVINMGEFKERHTVSRLIGSPPGYIGYNDGDGLLHETLSVHPRTIILLDEVEKADPSIYDLFLSAFDKGVIHTAANKEVCFKDSIIFMTSNLGANGNKKTVGIHETSINQDTIDVSEFEAHFRPEFINRITKVLSYKNLNKDTLIKIARKSLETLCNTIAEHNEWQVEVDEKIYSELVELSKNGGEYPKDARPIERAVETHISSKITEAVMSASGDFKKLHISLEGGLIEARVEF
ncbi:TPA: ATP-dependent Clp protease ATP-binding subunit [Vibrio vulnificus]|uniref:ATP-dependent Clp protease ATP-binding subunit n=1 Tax=Vibrio vulnificus TaxID=672 RepID=A0A8H9N1E6_VIBVL|nr:ATP-dependent Clp protease ATP-binding subunit [Vibrio vulnificus]HAS8540994.1 ATP-dependent Clp protease ATP-binding subunit [Vibrio vulnificus]